MAETAQDYFFVVEEDNTTPYADIYSSGNGREFLRPLARLALLHDAYEEARDDTVYGTLTSSNNNLSDVIRAEEQRDSYTGPLTVRSDELSNVLCVGNDFSSFTDIVQTYRSRVFDQVRDGVHTLEQTLDAITQLHEDVLVAQSMKYRWFDKDGIHTLSPLERINKGFGNAHAPRLTMLNRRTIKDRLSPDQKNAYFDAVPREAQACCLEQLDLRKNNGKINPRRPLRTAYKLQTIFGYTDLETGVFVDLLAT